MNNLDLFDSMVNEAIEELNNHGWREAPQNAVTLAAFGMMSHKVQKKVDRLAKPAWAIATSIGATALWYIISSLLGV